MVVGEAPDEIRVSREEYDDLTTRLANGDRADEMLTRVKRWRSEPQVVGQLELPLEWAEDRAGR